VPALPPPARLRADALALPTPPQGGSDVGLRSRLMGWGVVVWWFDGVCMPSLARPCRLRLAPALPSMASRSPLRKLCFLPAAPAGAHPSMASRSPLRKLCFLPAAPAGAHSSMASRSPLRKLRFLPASPAGVHPSMASRSPLRKLRFLPASPAGVHPFLLACWRFRPPAVERVAVLWRKKFADKVEKDGISWGIVVYLATRCGQSLGKQGEQRRHKDVSWHEYRQS